MRNISFSPPDISQSEIERVVEVIQSGWIKIGLYRKIISPHYNS